MDQPRKKHISLAEEKAALLGSFVETRSLILEDATRFESWQIDQKFIGTWNILDLLAHLRGWDVTNLQSARDILLGKLPDFYRKYDKDWQTFNAGLVARYRSGTILEMIKKTRESHITLLHFLEGLSPEQLLQDQGVRHGNYKVIISRLITAETRDEQKHHKQIRDYLIQPPEK